MKISALVTVPHGAKRDDEIAPLVARPLHCWLNAIGLGTRLLVNKKPRSSLDMNRPEARSAPFRQKVREQVLEGTGFLLDVHSFARGNPRYRSDVEMLLLYTPDVQDMGFYEEYAHALVEGADVMGLALRVEIQQATSTDDLVIDAHEQGQPADRLAICEHVHGGDPNAMSRAHAWAIHKVLTGQSAPKTLLTGGVC